MSLVQTQDERALLAEALGDTPETVIPAGLLLAGLADAHVCGEAPRFDGVVVQSHLLRREPWGFGCDPSAVWELLRPLNDWGRKAMSPNMSADLVPPVSALIERDTGVRVRSYGDVYHTLTGAVRELCVPEVRLLKPEDADLLSAYWDGSRAMGFATLEGLLTDGAAAGAVVEGRLVALAHTNAMTAKHGDIGVETDEAWRGRGFASASACLVARRIREMGRTPVWSTGEGNAASLRVAAKLGFVEVSRRVYLKAHGS